jgi:hypothetical protein
MEAIRSSEMSVRTQSAATCSRWFLVRGFFYPEDGGDAFFRNVGSHKIAQRQIPEDGILLSYRRENLKSYVLTSARITI